MSEVSDGSDGWVIHSIRFIMHVSLYEESAYVNSYLLSVLCFSWSCNDDLLAKTERSAMTFNF